MNLKKIVKKIELFCSISTIVYGGSLVFVGIILFLWLSGYTQPSLNDDNLLQIVFYVILALFFIFFGSAMFLGIYSSFLLLKTNSEENQIKSNVNLCAILNLFPIFLSIPGIIISKKLVNYYFNNIDFISKKQHTNENKQSNKDFEENFNNIINMQEQNVSSNKEFQINVNEPFVHNNKWMYFDGKDFYQTDEQNNWVLVKNFKFD